MVIRTESGAHALGLERRVAHILSSIIAFLHGRKLVSLLGKCRSLSERVVPCGDECWNRAGRSVCINSCDRHIVSRVEFDQRETSIKSLIDDSYGSQMLVLYQA